ncbi:zinc ribbon domain-containing protein [Candidatus Clostridium eludens]
MFFIGIFGIENKTKNILVNQNNICPLCSAYGRYDILKSYDYFHIFFIPLWKWNRRYFIKTHCCMKLCTLDNNIGVQIENGEMIEIKKEYTHCDSHNNSYNFCPHCSSQIDSTFYYCPYCGNRIHKNSN